MTEVERNLDERNRAYASMFPAADLPKLPTKHYAIVTCMDSRIDTFQAFGVDLGDAHIIRNAGGSARDAYRSLLVSQHMLQVKEILLIKHTHCGMSSIDDNQAIDIVLKQIEDEKGVEAREKAESELKDFKWGCFSEVEKSVRDDVEWLRSHAAFKAKVTGWIYDVDTGRVTKVDI